MGITAKIYSPIISFGKLFRSPLLLAIRLYWGIAFFKAGYGKLADIQSVAGFFGDLGIPYPLYNAYIAGGIECFGGLLLAFGFLSRLASIPLAITMIVAYATAHNQALGNIFTDFGGFVSQQPFNYLLTALIVLAFGPGKFSLDYIFGIECNKSKCQA